MIPIKSPELYVEEVSGFQQSAATLSARLQLLSGALAEPAALSEREGAMLNASLSGIDDQLAALHTTLGSALALARGELH